MFIRFVTVLVLVIGGGAALVLLGAGRFLLVLLAILVFVAVFALVRRLVGRRRTVLAFAVATRMLFIITFLVTKAKQKPG